MRSLFCRNIQLKAELRLNRETLSLPVVLSPLAAQFGWRPKEKIMDERISNLFLLQNFWAYPLEQLMSALLSNFAVRCDVWGKNRIAFKSVFFSLSICTCVTSQCHSRVTKIEVCVEKVPVLQWGGSVLHKANLSTPSCWNTRWHECYDSFDYWKQNMKRKAVKSCMGIMQTPFSVVLANLLNTLLFYFKWIFWIAFHCLTAALPLNRPCCCSKFWLRRLAAQSHWLTQNNCYTLGYYEVHISLRRIDDEA